MSKIELTATVFFVVQMGAIYYMSLFEHSDQSALKKVMTSSTFWLIFLVAHIAWVATSLHQGNFATTLPGFIGCIAALYYLGQLKHKKST